MNENQKLIFLVEDEETLSTVLCEYLTTAGYRVETRFDGSHVVEDVQQMRPDLILLDLMLPGKDGLEICKEIRTFSGVPIIMVTARVEEIDRLLGLELGADDYVCKPYSPREVTARVKAVLRRASGTQDKENTAVFGLVLDEERYQATLHGTLLDLTPVEFRLLKIFCASPGKVFSRDQLIGSIYEDQRIVTDRTIDTHIKNLRKKMEPHLTEGELIHSIYGVGYKLDL